MIFTHLSEWPVSTLAFIIAKRVSYIKVYQIFNLPDDDAASTNSVYIFLELDHIVARD